MSFVRQVALPSPIFDYQTTIFDAIEYLIINDCEYAFIKKEEGMVGIVSLEKLVENYSSRDFPVATVIEYMEPLICINESAHKSKATNLMRENNVEHIAVTNRNGNFVGIASAKQLETE